MRSGGASSVIVVAGCKSGRGRMFGPLVRGCWRIIGSRHPTVKVVGTTSGRARLLLGRAYVDQRRYDVF